MWFQVTNLLYKVDASFNADLTCDYAVGGICKLANPCSSYTNLWDAGWTFNFMFQGAVDYVLVPLGALAEEDTTNNQCNIHIQFLNENKHSQSGQVVIGSMILSMFKNYVNYDLATFVTTYQFQLSDSNTLNDAYIGSAQLSELNNPFRLLYGASEQIFINTDLYEYKSTIGGQLGFQLNTQFQVSLLGQYVQTFELDCLRKAGGTRYTSCEDQPTNAQNYFNSTVYYNGYTTPTYGPSPYGGYNTSGYTFNSNICAKTVGTKYFCSNSPVTFYSADSVYNNNWNYGSAAASGIMGMGKSSPIWEIVGNPPTKEFDVYMANYNDWTFADADWTATT